MLIIPITDGLRIIATEHAWETQGHEEYTSGNDKWRFIAHHTTIINALVNIRQRLTKNSKRKGLVSAQAEVDKLLIASLTSQDKFIKQLISLHGDKKIETINLRSEDEKITM
jgi:hypothetical protein